jgi:hypothetical protein
MRHKFFCLVLLCLCVTTGYAQTDGNEHYFMEASLDPAQASVGQKITVSVVIGVDSYFSGVTELALPDMDHALVLHEEPAINGSKSIDDRDYTTQTHRINVYPDREGILLVPSFGVTFTQAVLDADDLRSDTVQLRTPPMLVIARVPASMHDTQGFIVSNAVEINDQWESEDRAEFKVGDVLTRVVTIAAAEMSAMTMPQFNPHVPRGMSVTLAEPALSSTSGREELGATIVQRMSYAVEAPGHYELGGETLHWYDPSDALRHEYAFAVKAVNAGGLPWVKIVFVMFTLLAVCTVFVLWRRYLRCRDPVDVAIRERLGSSQPATRLAAVYAYADYHQPQALTPARLRVLLASSGALVEKSLSGQFSRNAVPGSPTRRESRTLYRQLSKK